MTDDLVLIAIREFMCAVAVALFSCAGALIMQIPRADRRTLFIFPAFLSLVVGGSLLVYGIEKFSALKFIAAALVPFALVRIVRVATPLWLMILLSYVTLIAAIVDADWLLETSGFR